MEQSARCTHSVQRMVRRKILCHKNKISPKTTNMIFFSVSIHIASESNIALFDLIFGSLEYSPKYSGDIGSSNSSELLLDVNLQLPYILFSCSWRTSANSRNKPYLLQHFFKWRGGGRVWRCHSSGTESRWGYLTS